MKKQTHRLALLVVVLGGMLGWQFSLPLRAQDSFAVQDAILVVRDMYLVEKTRYDEIAREQVHQAIRILGEHRVTDALPDLCNLLEFAIELPYDSERPSPREVYPAIEALFRIGGPSLPAVAEAVASSQRSRQLVFNGIRVFQLVEGSNEGARRALVHFALPESGLRRDRLKDFVYHIPVVIDRSGGPTPRWELPKELQDDGNGRWATRTTFPEGLLAD
jgi:hypothetical protein